MLSFKIKGEITFDVTYTTSIKNPIPSEAKCGDFYEDPSGRRKYILEIIGDRAMFLDYWNYIDGAEIVYYSQGMNCSKLSNLRRWGVHGNR